MAAIVVIMLVVLAVLFVNHAKKEGSGNWIPFFAKGKEVGFSVKEVEMLKRLATRCDIHDPVSIFRSQKQLDACIRSMVQGIRMSGESEEQGTQDFLSKLFDYRKQIEMEKPEIKSGISSSRQMGEGQPIRILVPGVGVYRSEVVKNIGNNLTISRPVNNKITTALQWHGLKISIYFWRDDDAGYVFDTDVIDEVFSKGISSLKVDHCDSLFRTQKRKSLRLKIHKDAFLYLANDNDTPGKVERAPGLNCLLEDLSDTGCAVRVGGQASSGMRVKIQFALEHAPVCMVGTVRSVDFREDTNRSLMHIQADPLPLVMRNLILSEIFGMISEDDEDELPFRVLEEEAEKTSIPAAGNEDPAMKFQEMENG